MKFSKRKLNEILKDKNGIKELKIETTLYLDVDEMGDSPYCEFILSDKYGYKYKTKVFFNLVFDFDNKEITIEDVQQIGKRKLPKEYKYQKNWIKEFRNYDDLFCILDTEFVVSILEELELKDEFLQELQNFDF